MKLLLVGSCLFFLYANLIATEDSNSTIRKITSKEAEKLYPKKFSVIKKNSFKTSLKKLVDITDKFKELPADDLAFIKELDTQFKLHGGKVIIKVVNNNVTDAKNSKRTIDGELGYGYAYNGYQYNQPKFMFYPYSQQNIDSNAPRYFLTGDGKTEVSIEPSYSYELKSQSYISHNEPQIDVPKPEHQQHMEHFPEQQDFQQQNEEPVIVLRIPGPAKYATHLQMLLQKYLEIRAAQYLHILEESEHRTNQQQHQLQQLDYGHRNNDVPDVEHISVPEQHVYTQQMQNDLQKTVTPHSIQYPEIDNVYQRYKNRYSSQNEQAQQPVQGIKPYYTTQQNEEELHTTQYDHEPLHQQQDQNQYRTEQFQYHQQVQEQPQFYYTHQAESQPDNTYQQVYIVSMIPQRQADYADSQEQPEKQPTYVQDQSKPNEHSSSLAIAENNPRPSHTKVLFTDKNGQSTYNYQMYQLPSIKPNERHASTSTPDYHQDFKQQTYQNLQGKQTSQESSAYYQQQYNAADTSNAEVVAITPKPYNYHAHSVKARARGRTLYSSRASTTGDAGKNLQKSRE